MENLYNYKDYPATCQKKEWSTTLSQKNTKAEVYFAGAHWWINSIGNDHYYQVTF